MCHSDEAPRLVTRAVRKTARYALAGRAPDHATGVWFVLHGYGQLVTRFIRPFADIVPNGHCIVAPEGLSRFYVDWPAGDGRHLQRVGATWMTREQREADIADTMAWLDTVFDDVMHVPPRDLPVGVLGFSQGVATATRWVAHRRLRPRAFVGWAGSLAHDVDDDALAAALAHTRVTLVRGDDDPLMSAEQVQHELSRLRRAAPDAKLVTFAGAHHVDGLILSSLLSQLSPP
jgi:predicted esterase